jgi:hypothetical protein
MRVHTVVIARVDLVTLNILEKVIDLIETSFLRRILGIHSLDKASDPLIRRGECCIVCSLGKLAVGGIVSLTRI